MTRFTRQADYGVVRCLASYETCEQDRFRAEEGATSTMVADGYLRDLYLIARPSRHHVLMAGLNLEERIWMNETSV